MEGSHLSRQRTPRRSPRPDVIYGQDHGFPRDDSLATSIDRRLDGRGGERTERGELRSTRRGWPLPRRLGCTGAYQARSRRSVVAISPAGTVALSETEARWGLPAVGTIRSQGPVQRTRRQGGKRAVRRYRDRRSRGGGSR